MRSINFYLLTNYEKTDTSDENGYLSVYSHGLIFDLGLGLGLELGVKVRD